MAEQLEAINAQAVAIARAVCQQEGRGQVAASMGPTGYFTQPLGEVGFAEMVDIYAQQARALASAGPDYLLLETFSDLGEMRAALLACRSVCDIPVICSMTYMKSNRTLTGQPASGSGDAGAAGRIGHRLQLFWRTGGAFSGHRGAGGDDRAAAGGAAQCRAAVGERRRRDVSFRRGGFCSGYAAFFALSSAVCGWLLRDNA